MTHPQGEPVSPGEKDPVPAPEQSGQTQAEEPPLVQQVKNRLNVALAQNRQPDMEDKETQTKQNIARLLAVVRAAAPSFPTLLAQHPGAGPELTKDMLMTLVSTPGALKELRAVLPYSDNKELYATLMEQGMQATEWQVAGQSVEELEAFSQQCKVSRANLKRRERDLDGALKDFTEVLQFVEQRISEQRLHPDAPSKGLIKYEIGYIHFLRDELSEAEKFFGQSSDDDAAVGREIGSLISGSQLRVVQRMQGGDLDEIREYLTTARGQFQAKSAADPDALRWVRVLNKQLIDVAIEKGDVAEAERLFEELRDDPWLARNRGKVSANENTRREAALAALKGSAQEALDTLMPLLQDANAEGIAEQYLLAGEQLMKTGKESDARELWEQALRLPVDNGNAHWQRKIQAKL